jgi:hypothetical protein
MAAAANAVHGSIATPELPAILEPFKFVAPRFIKGGGYQTINLVKRPVLPAQPDEQSEAILAIWDEWWHATPYGSDPTKDNPRWSSSCRTGDIWTRYGEATGNNSGNPHVYCLNCSLVLQHPQVKSCGTKHMATHLRSNYCLLQATPIHDEFYTPLPLQNQRQPRATSYSVQAYEKELVRLVIDQGWSFRTVEKLSFQRFIQFLRPEAVIINRYKFGQLFEKQFTEAAATLLHDLGTNTKISIALDAWTSNNHLSFLAVKGYYINNSWQLCEKLLDFIPMRGKHSGASMAEEVIRVLINTKTTHQLLGLTCDNASNNNVLSRLLEESLEKQGFTWSAKENTIPCLAHVIDLVVQDIILYLKLSAAYDEQLGGTLQQHHIQDIEPEISVPNSLRKVSLVLLQLFITY